MQRELLTTGENKNDFNELLGTDMICSFESRRLMLSHRTFCCRKVIGWHFNLDSPPFGWFNQGNLNLIQVCKPRPSFPGAPLRWHHPSAFLNAFQFKTSFSTQVPDITWGFNWPLVRFMVAFKFVIRIVQDHSCRPITGRESGHWMVIFVCIKTDFYVSQAQTTVLLMLVFTHIQ